MRKNPNTPAGSVHRLTVDSHVLKGNLLGDASHRIIDVYVPHGHDGRGMPLLVDVVGFTAGGPAWHLRKIEWGLRRNGARAAAR